VWAQLIATALGIWLMAAPDVLGHGEPARTNDQIVGPLVATFAFIAVWEVTRGLRWLNAVLGAWLVVAPALLGYPEPRSIINSVVVGVVVIGLSLVRGAMTERFGGGWRSLWRSAEA
jgi:predicted cobalt transporter CbtA